MPLWCACTIQCPAQNFKRPLSTLLGFCAPQAYSFPLVRSPQNPQRPQATPNTTVIIGVMVVAAFIMILNETIVSIAIPHLAKTLNVSAGTRSEERRVGKESRAR